MRWRNIGLLSVALLALGNAVTFGQEKAKAAVEQDKPKVDSQERDSDEKKLLKRQMDELSQLRKEFQKQGDDTQRLLTQIRSALAEMTGFRDRKGVEEVLGPTQVDVQRLRMEVVGLAARKDALEAAVSKAAAQGRDLAAADPIARELTKLVSLREEVLEGYKKDAHEARSIAMAQLVETRIKLEERLALLRTGPISNARFVDRLLDTTISLAESQARLKQSEALLEKIRNPQVDRFLDEEQVVKDRLFRIRHEERELEVTYQKLGRQALGLDKKPAK